MHLDTCLDAHQAFVAKSLSGYCKPSYQCHAIIQYAASFNLPATLTLDCSGEKTVACLFSAYPIINIMSIVINCIVVISLITKILSNCCCDEPLFASMNSAQVWCWRNEHVPPQCRLMQHLDDWSALREYLSYEFHAQNSCLKTFMHMLLRGQPHHDHLQVTPFSIRFSQRSSSCCVGCYVCDGPFCASKHSCRLEFSPVRACYLTLSAGTHCKWQSCGQQAWLIIFLACFAQICTC